MSMRYPSSRDFFTSQFWGLPEWMMTVSATSLSMSISSRFRASTSRALSAASEIVVGLVVAMVVLADPGIVVVTVDRTVVRTGDTVGCAVVGMPVDAGVGIAC